MSKKPPLRGYILRAAKIIFPIGKTPCVRFLFGEPEKSKNRVTLYAFHDARLVCPGWAFHTNREVLAQGGPKSRLSLFVDARCWRTDAMQKVVAVEIEQRNDQAIWGVPVYAPLALLSAYYIETLALLNTGKAQLQARRNFLSAIREQRE